MKSRILVASALITTVCASAIHAAGVREVDLAEINLSGFRSDGHALYDMNGRLLPNGEKILFENKGQRDKKKKIKIKKKKQKKGLKKRKKKN